MATNPKKKITKTYASRMLRILLVMVFFAAVIHLILQYLNLEVFYQQNGHAYELSNRFDMDDESSVQTWLSQVIFLISSLGALLASLFQSDKAARRLWQIIAAIGLIFSLDEATTLHEYVLQSLHVAFFQDASPTGFANAWWIVAPFIIIVAGWLAWRTWQLLPRRTALLFLVAGVTFLTGAAGVDLLTSIAERETFLNQGILAATEETLELLGSITALYAIVSYLEDYHATSIKGALLQLGLGRRK